MEDTRTPFEREIDAVSQFNPVEVLRPITVVEEKAATFLEPVGTGER